jgi:hypothetical protein
MEVRQPLGWLRRESLFPKFGSSEGDFDGARLYTPTSPLRSVE